MLIHCEVTDGPRPKFKTIGVHSSEGHTEFFSIEERFLLKRKGETLLPVRQIVQDRQQKLYLIQLPVEADSGANRVWIEAETVYNEDEVIA